MKYSFVIIGNQKVEGIRLEEISFFFPNYSCVGNFPNNSQAIEYIIKFKPHLVFINMDFEEAINGVTYNTVSDMFQYLDAIPYFIALNSSTACSFQAIQSGFSDYLTQCDIHTLGKTLLRFEKRTPFPLQHSICIRSYTDYQIINFQDIMYLKADNNSTDFKTVSGKSITAFKTLKHFEQNLPANFIRVHKSYIVNIQYVSRLQFSKSKCLLNFNQEIPISNSYRESLESILIKNGVTL